MSDDPQEPPVHPFGKRANGRTNGHEPGGMGTQPVPLDDVREPLDLVAVQADDELINALSAGFAVSAPGVHGYDADDHVAAMLAAWKADVDAEPIPEIDLDAAVDAVLAGSRPAVRRRPSGKMRHLVPVASAAALIVVAITGVSIAAHDTRPGDPLFPISKVLYAEEARSYEALDTVEQSRERARQALAEGDKAGAEAALAEGQAAAESVLAEHGRGEVEQKLHKLGVVVDDSEQGVPTVVEDDEPSRGGGADPSGSGTADPSESDPSDPADPSGTAGEPSEGADPSESADPEKPATSEPGTSEPSEPGTSEPGTSEPRPTTSKPDPRVAEEPPPPATEPSTAPEPSVTSTSKPPKEPAEAGTAPAASEPAAPPATTTPPAAKPPATGADPATTATAAPPSRTKPPGTGISGASMSATGTATPSGEPTS